MPLDTGIVESSQRDCGYLQIRVNPSIEVSQRDATELKVASWTASRKDYCMNAYAEFLQLTHELNDIYRTYPVLGETWDDSPAFNYISKKASIPKELKSYDQDLNRRRPDELTRSCMQRVQNPSGAPQVLAGLQALDKVTTQKKVSMLESIKSLLQNLCENPKEQIHAAIKNPAFMRSYYACDKPLFSTLRVFSDLPAASSQSTDCARRMDSSRFLCMYHNELQTQAENKELSAQMMQLGMDMLFIAAPGIGFTRPSLPAILTGVGIGGGLGYVLAPTQDEVDEQVSIQITTPQLGLGTLDQRQSGEAASKTAKGIPFEEAVKKWQAEGTYSANMEKLKPFFDKMVSIDDDCRRMNQELWGIKLSRKAGDKKFEAGIDIGAPPKFQNLFIDEQGIITVVDW